MWSRNKWMGGADIKYTLCGFTVKPVITDPEKRTTSVQQTAHLPLIDFTIDIMNLREADTSQLRTTDTDQSPMYLSQYRITSENGQ